MQRRKVLILGAAGRDFHNFNVVYRNDPSCEVVAFTGTQIPDIARRRYPPELAGPYYPQGIPIVPEEELESWIERERVDEVVFAYSDVSHEHVMHLASRAVAAGADYRLLGARATMLRARVPVVSVCAVRTGAGKSQTSRRVARILREQGVRVVVVRHPMPYGPLRADDAVQRFATLEDLDRYGCTIEEREEFEPHLSQDGIVYAGIDYGAVLERAQQEGEMLLWDGGNNDLPFFVPDLEIVVVDPHRPGHEVRYYPGEANLRRAHVIVINKVGTAAPENVARVREQAAAINPRALILEADSPVSVSEPERLRGARVLVIEDGPTLTHGEMPYGAGVIAARQHGAALLVDPRPYAVGSIAETFRHYPHLEQVLPAMGYGERQIRELERTILSTPCDVVVVATPVDLRRLMRLEKPAVRVTYELAERGRPSLEEVLAPLVERVRASRLSP